VALTCVYAVWKTQDHGRWENQAEQHCKETFVADLTEPYTNDSSFTLIYRHIEVAVSGVRGSNQWNRLQADKAIDFFFRQNMPSWPLYDEPLPKCKGPRLYPFQECTATIDFVRLISDADSVDTSQEGHAHVFEVSIASKCYAMKIVCDKILTMTALSVSLIQNVGIVQIRPCRRR